MTSNNAMNQSGVTSTALIHVARQGVVLGKFSLPELRARLSSGEVLRSDHYWKVGLPGWSLIGSTFDGQPMASPAPAVPVRPTSVPSALSVPSSAGRPRVASRALLYWVGGIIALFVLSQGHAYVILKAPLDKAIRSDSRNRGIEASTYFHHHIPGNAIVLDIESIGPETKTIDMMRVLLQFAETQKDIKYDWVVLSCRGRERFKMKGAHFRTLGQDYGSENPMYTMRTLPENIYRLDGTRAFPVWEGGALGVMAEQMKNFSEFTVEWLR